LTNFNSLAYPSPPGIFIFSHDGLRAAGAGDDSVTTKWDNDKRIDPDSMAHAPPEQTHGKRTAIDYTLPTQSPFTLRFLLCRISRLLLSSFPQG
jgi:hypothetical protein